MQRIGIALDIDGVLIRGKKVLPQAIRAIEKIKKNKVPFILLTNGGGMAEANKAQELSDKLGSEIKPYQMILAHTPMAPLAANYSHNDSDAVLILGKDTCRDVAFEYGFKHPILSEEILAACPEVWPFRAPSDKYSPVEINRRVGAILSFHDSLDWGRDIQIRQKAGDNYCNDSNRKQLPVYFSNGDLVWSNNLSLTRLAQGSFRNALENGLSGGRKLQRTMFGKPCKSTYDFAKNAIDRHATELYGFNPGSLEKRLYFGVGDNPESDIEGANRAGWASVLVKTGVYESGSHNATALVEDVEEAGVLVAKKDYNLPKHNEVDVPNLHVIKALQSLESRGLVHVQFSWQYYYYFLNDAGIEYLRKFLHLPVEIVPRTHIKTAKAPGVRPGREERPRGERRDGGDGYRRRDDGEKKEGASGDFRPEFRGGIGRGGPRPTQA
ncbi:hypothetical protein HK100_004060 [Physocladia obscura]|uniref:Plectin/eS10 N-terminal domain-containing protein n=1 Tax=Physocladia obscura TaxID=109957 RepID=A0AAD5T7H4_9FUNG|nr:hypothetical protein HK100_004060 [Physocladia obscura]